MTTQLPPGLQQTPDLDAWLRVEEDETVTVFTGKVEIGQGIGTTIAQIAAEELDVAVARTRVVLADTARTPDEGYTAGSNSTQGSGSAVRWAAAEARHVLVTMAAAQWNVPVERLRVFDGIIVDPVSEQQTSYWELMGGRRFDRQIAGDHPPKAPETYTLVGQSVPRLDIPAKVRGEPVFVADMELPGMAHGRVVRPPRPHATLADFDASTVETQPGVLSVVRNGDFLGVVAEREDQAMRAAEGLRAAAVWQGGRSLPDEDTVYDHLRNAPGQSFLVVDGVATDAPIPVIETPTAAAQTLSATFYRPFQMHGALGPSAALAQWTDGDLAVWTHSQGVFPLRTALAQVLGMDEARVRLIHVEGPGCYGHNGADDVVLDAALLARATPGRPVLVQWSRADEHRWEPYGSAMVVSVQASVDATGTVIDWNHDVWSYAHINRPRPVEGVSALLAAQQLDPPLPAPPARPGLSAHSGSHRNADPIYDFPHRRIVKHFVPDSPVRTSALRSLGAFANGFAIESMMDELALAAETDPMDFRLRHLSDERARAVLQSAADTAGWQPGVRYPSAGKGRGQGIAFARYKNEKCYAAVAVDLSVDDESGAIHLERIVIAADAGQIINPDGLRNQLEGGAVQAASWTLREAVQFADGDLASVDWEHYPILRMAEAPAVEVVLLDRPGAPPLGAGEATQVPTPAAIANAVYHAAGVRLRRLPFTLERVQAARDGAGNLL